MKACAFAAIAIAAAAQAKPQAQGNLGLGLRELTEFHATHAGVAPAQLRSQLDRQFPRAPLVVLDGQGRVRVNVHLDGRAPLEAVRRNAQRLGVQTIAANASYRHGVFTAFVPIAKATELARLEGVRSVLLSPPPVTNVGTTTSQGAAVVKADQVNTMGYTGAGITVGVLSDSYDKATNTPIHAANDVASGDLPGAANPLGHTQPVVVLQDATSGTDEGRGMAQIVHDLAPDAKLCFATAFNGDVSFADNIRALADKTGPCGADVIVDDVIYFFEPMFSDGVIAQAADDVAAMGVSYFSSAGNRGSTQGYLSGFRGVADAVARGSSQTVDLGLITPGNSNGGFHNYNPDPAAAADVSQTVTLASSSNTVVMQWNDPFDRGGITTDYDLYVYDAAGTTLVAVSADDNTATDEPVEAVSLPPGTYQFVVVRYDSGTPQPVADQIRFITFGTVFSGEYLDFKTPTTYGHNSAKGAMGTAALAWFTPYLPESFESLGRGTFYFDAEGNRLATPEVRNKPDIAAPDGVNTTFFPVGGDSLEDTDTFPNFFGTSAAAPHAAGVAALVLQAGGGPGSVPPNGMRRLLQKTATAHDGSPNAVKARATAGDATVIVHAHGDGGNWSGINPDAFSVTLEAPKGYSLQSLTLDVSTSNPQRVFLGVPAPGLQFDPRVGPGFPVTFGKLDGLAAGDITVSPLNQIAPFSQQLTFTFAPGAFGRFETMDFGVDRDEAAIGAGGNSVDLIAGGTISGVVIGPSGQSIPFSAPFENRRFGVGYSVLDGWGLIDAVKAVQNLP